MLAEVIDRRHVFEQDRELVAAEAGDCVAGAHRVAEAITDCGQEIVADSVAEAVVHRLESVEVEHDHTDRALST